MPLRIFVVHKDMQCVNDHSARPLPLQTSARLAEHSHTLGDSHLHRCRGRRLVQQLDSVVRLAGALHLHLCLCLCLRKLAALLLHLHGY